MKRKNITAAYSEPKEFWLDRFLLSNSKISFNSHLTLNAQFLGCDPKKLQDEKFITSTILSSIVQGRMRLIDFLIKKFEGGGQGITAVALIADSHIIVNTFPETTSLILDVYACTGAPINVMYEFVRRFNPKKFDFLILPRIIRDENIPSRVVLDEKDINDSKLRKWMKERGLLPLINTSEEFLILANFIGFVFGDGHLHKNLNYASLWQKNKYVLELMKEKLAKIKVRGEIKINKSKAGKEVFELQVNDRNFCKLLFLLGTPKGSKIEHKLKLPWWLDKKEPPIVGAFLSSLLFSELSKPKSKYTKVRGTVIPYITFTMVTKKENKNDMKKFLEGIKELLKCFSITSSKISVRKEDDKLKFILRINASKNNLMRIQSLISLTKIFPIGVFGPINFKEAPPLYKKNSGFYKIIDYLLKNKTTYGLKMFKDLGISQQKGYKWLKILNHSNIIKREKRGRKELIALNVRT